MTTPLEEQTLLEAAAQAFAKYGYEGVSMRDLCEQCGVSTRVVYYRFASKEELYHEACGYALDAFLDTVVKRFNETPPGEWRPELLAESFFDAWTQNPTSLMLANRDVINALVQPERWLTARQYPRVIKLIRDLLGRHLKRGVDDALAFSFAATAMGFYSLMLIEERHAAMVAPAGQVTDRAQYLQQRKAVLVALYTRMWEGAFGLPSPE